MYKVNYYRLKANRLGLRLKPPKAGNIQTQELKPSQTLLESVIRLKAEVSTVIDFMILGFIGKLVLFTVLIFTLTSCNAALPGHTSDSQSLAPLKSNEVLSPFTQFENLKKKGETGISNEQVDNILRSYGIYDSVRTKVTKEVYNDSACSDVRINGFDVGNKKIAVLLISKGHLHIYVMFSNSSDKWTVDGFAFQSEREKPEYRVEQSGDGTKYWLVVKHEANHGTGLQIFDEVWYHPDGSVAGEYPVKGSTLFFPQSIEPEANTYFSSSAYYDGNSRISLSYSISFEYIYRKNPQGSGDFKFQSKYRPAVLENWEYDLKTQQFEFVSCDPALPESCGAMKHTASAEYGILQGYIDFYRLRLGNQKVTTLGEWENLMELK